MISTLTFTKRLVSFVLALMFISTQFTLAQVDISTLTEAKFKALSKEEQQQVLNEIRAASPLFASPAVPPNTVNCFDYYSFGSVQVDLSPTLEQTIPGMPITFTGTLKNANTYPVVGGQVYAKIFKSDAGDTDLTHQNGHPLVSFFLVQASSYPSSRTDCS